MDLNTTIYHIALIAAGAIIVLKIIDRTFDVLILRMEHDHPKPKSEEHHD